MRSKNIPIKLLFSLAVIGNMNKNDRIYSPLSDWHQLQLLDDDITNLGLYFFNIIMIFSKINWKYGMRKKFELVGSLKEGGIITQLFKLEQLTERVQTNKAEVDIEHIFYELPKRLKLCVKDINNKRGFTRLQVTQNRCHCLACLNVKKSAPMYYKARILEAITSNQGYLQSYITKGHFLGGNPPRLNTFFLYLKIALSILLDKPLSQISITSGTRNVTKSTITASFQLHVNGKAVFQLNFDFALIVKINWSPGVLNNWANRKRNWPNLNDLSNEMAIGYIIIKPSFEEKLSISSTELRYSFAHLERKIVSLQSRNQRLIYYIFKAMIYKWLKPIEPNFVTSYLGKTVMFWTCEKYPPHSKFWDNHNDAILKAVQFLFQQLLDAFKKHYLPYYFISEINTLKDIPNATVKELIFTTTDIIKSMQNFLPHETSKILNDVNNALNLIYKAKDIMTEVLEKRPSSFLPHIPAELLSKIITDELDDILKK